MGLNAEHKKLVFSNRASFLIAGFCIAAWAPMIPYVKDNFALDEHNLGLLLLCVGIGSFVSMPTSGYFSSKFGCRLPIYVASVVVALCLLSIPLINNIYVLGLVLFIMGVAAIALDVISNINAVIVEKVSQRNIMSGLHGLYSVGGFLGALSVTFLLSSGLSLALTGVYAAVVVLLLIFLGGKDLCNSVYASEEEEQEAKAKKAQEAAAGKKINYSYYFHPIILLIGLMCFIMFMTEGSILDWSGVFLHTERGVSLEHAGYGYAAFAIAMTTCRLLGDRVVSRFGRGRVLIFGAICVAAGFCLAVFVPTLITAFLGFALIGVGASNVVPQLVSVSARVKEVPMHISVTIVNTLGFTGMLVGPALIGFLAHAITLPMTYLCQAGAVLCVAVMSYILLRTLRKQMPAVAAGASVGAEDGAAAPADPAASAASAAPTAPSAATTADKAEAAKDEANAADSQDK